MIRSGRPLHIFRENLMEAIADAQDILDIGTSQRFAKELRPFEQAFAGKRYLAAGYKPSLTFGRYNCDLDLDVTAIALPNASFDCVLCLEVLEHCTDPFAAARELVRILRPGGSLLLTVPFLLGFHGKGSKSAPDNDNFPDFWRFTYQGLEHLFGELNPLRVVPVDGRLTALLGQARLGRFIQDPPLRQLVDLFEKPELGKATTRHLVLGRKAR